MLFLYSFTCALHFSQLFLACIVCMLKLYSFVCISGALSNVFGSYNLVVHYSCPPWAPDRYHIGRYDVISFLLSFQSFSLLIECATLTQLAWDAHPFVEGSMMPFPSISCNEMTPHSITLTPHSNHSCSHSNHTHSLFQWPSFIATFRFG